MSHILTIDASPKQLSKLRNGHPVRIKRGTGFNLIVRPDTYHLVSRAFARNKGIQVALSPEEIEANRSLSPEQHMELKESQPEMAGQGIFGKKFDKLLKKAGIKKLAYSIGDQIKPLAKAGITAGLTAGATSLGAIQPELIPFLPGGVAGLSGLAYDYLDNPSKYQSGFSGIKGKPVRSLAEQAVKTQLNQKLNEQLGTNYDYLSRAGLENAAKGALQAQLDASSIGARYASPVEAEQHRELYGYGLSRRREIGSIRGRGSSIMSGSHFPPALVSQPFSANFQMSHFLPVQYQHFNSGSGLYAGKGLYT
jgi:hypothetical protein